ncbi:LLM class flavin-dependent oxidoreductase [Beijerinckia indica]|uniref:Alkanesulfonate monooxygenase n=1 Tax=Beijerinckia indica subsp. indica (strain ATCC 9039 / DSM 1715 / NCIMB 8712) TaxID=395963 RepID=B2IIZ9_BEII9|nr:LLM class flavin-dependent oxidoreductase [Beijerinckia indica]ACB96210.1 Alkanesulfonate monooxygenase [Beijerinckia indica subsp. indica ATCC 9039]
MSDLAQTEGRERTKTNALFNDNKLKLGVFGVNCDSGCAMTVVEERHKLSWELTKQIAQVADKAGFEVMVPVARWMGIGGPTNFNGRNFETYTWSAGLAAITNHITLTTTSHVQTTHPVFAAKQAATIDHISGGRYCLNVVCGWFSPEFEMFGVPFMDHDLRYDYADEWFSIVKRLWTEEGSSCHQGKYFQIKDAFSMPKPIQLPLPPVMNAGGSEKGRNFIASQCDVGYMAITDHNDMEAIRRQVEKYRRLAQDKFGRQVQVWTPAYVVQRDSDKEAEDYLRYYAIEKGNEMAADASARYLGVNSEIMPEAAWQTFKLHLKGGYGGYSLVGTAETIAERLARLSDAGIDGVAVNWVDYLDGLNRFNAEVMPLLERANLRKPFSPQV